jgi:hypothetical protein
MRISRMMRTTAEFSHTGSRAALARRTRRRHAAPRNRRPPQAPACGASGASAPLWRRGNTLLSPVWPLRATPGSAGHVVSRTRLALPQPTTNPPATAQATGCGHHQEFRKSKSCSSATSRRGLSLTRPRTGLGEDGQHRHQDRARRLPPVEVASDCRQAHRQDNHDQRMNTRPLRAGRIGITGTAVSR